MKIILSIKPIYVSLILSNIKKYEYRRSIFKREVDIVLIYSSSPEQRVVGEFSVEEVLHFELGKLWDETNIDSGISKDFFFQYFNDLEKGYAIKIGKVKKYKQPKLLSEFGDISPPQSFIYV